MHSVKNFKYIMLYCECYTYYNVRRVMRESEPTVQTTLELEVICKWSDLRAAHLWPAHTWMYLSSTVGTQFDCLMQMFNLIKFTKIKKEKSKARLTIVPLYIPLLWLHDAWGHGVSVSWLVITRFQGYTFNPPPPHTLFLYGR